MLLLVEAEQMESLDAQDMPETHYEIIYFSGRVQGVGFRYSALQVSKEFEVTGFVKNEVDGRVLLEVEGKKSQVNAFIAAIEERMHGYIRQVERNARRRDAGFQGFSIR